jgi:choline/glycine/proline betaine transport protein
MDSDNKQSISDYIEKNMNAPVFFISAVLIISIAILGFFFSEVFEDMILSMNSYLITKFSWLIVSSITLFVAFTIYLYFSKFGDIKLGGDYSTPEYSFFSWISMLFSAGMGIGILFYGVAEPVMHYMNPPVGGVSNELVAMKYSFLNWGLHAWATYIIVALALAYVGYRRELPLSIRFTFYPLLKDKVYGWWGHLIDIFAVVSTLFGVATSLGLGVIQINTGLTHLFGIENSLPVKIALIMFITSLATFSVVTGVKKGIKWFSIVNICLGAFLLLFVFLLGPTLHIFKYFFLNMGVYIKDFIDLSVVKTFTLNKDWLSNWTLFYWAWWISWAPYVGMFIARISKGRTIKEFIFGVLLVPTVLTFLWLSVFGNSSIFLFENGASQIGSAIENDVSTSLFVFLANLPFSSIISFIAVILIITFFVTSSDSGSFVIDIITSGGKDNPAKTQRVFWSLLEGITASVLLIGGGLIALQTAVISMAIPFSIILILMCISILKALQTEYYSKTALKKAKLDDLKVRAESPQSSPATSSSTSSSATKKK